MGYSGTDCWIYNFKAFKLQAVAGLYRNDSMRIMPASWKKRHSVVYICPSEFVTCGSILGPLLFTLYVNDMVNAGTSDLCLYADDSMLVVGGRDVNK